MRQRELWVRKSRRLTEQISKFEAKLDEARKKKERAIARAQLTKSGFVYVISNIGSFGDRIFKIGMTRRLEPMDRIYELSGASVPFPSTCMPCCTRMMLRAWNTRCIISLKIGD